MRIRTTLAATALAATAVLGGAGLASADDAPDPSLLTTPVNLPAQAFSIGGTFVGQGHGLATDNTLSNLGR